MSEHKCDQKCIHELEALIEEEQVRANENARQLAAERDAHALTQRKLTVALEQFDGAMEDLAAERQKVAMLVEAWPGDDDYMVSNWDEWWCVGSDHATQYSPKRAAVFAAAGIEEKP